MSYVLNLGQGSSLALFLFRVPGLPVCFALVRVKSPTARGLIMSASYVDELVQIEVIALLKPCHTLLKHKDRLSFNRDFQRSPDLPLYSVAAN